MVKNDLNKIAEKAKKEGLLWDFDDESENAEEEYKISVPGRIIDYIYKKTSDKEVAIQTIGLLTTYAARRSLSCWFLYCKYDYPLYVTYQLEDYWINSFPDHQTIDPSWCQQIAPVDSDGNLIVDCRYSDTSLSSLSVAEAAKFALSKNFATAACSIICAYDAFGQSPLGGYDGKLDEYGGIRLFPKWVVEIAVPVIMEKQVMDIDELFGLSDFEIPEIMLKPRD